MKKFIGRQIELNQLFHLIDEDYSKICAIIGRRGIGKTTLSLKLKEKLQENFSINDYHFFELYGQKKVSTKLQLKNFIDLTKDYFSFTNFEIKESDDWNSFFNLLKNKIELQHKVNPNKKLIFFIDEFPWLHVKQSNFIQSFSTFWNFIQNKNNIYFILTGSAVSWMNRNVINTSGGLYGKVTNVIYLKPFNFIETVEYLKQENPNYNLNELLCYYFFTGGVARYLERIRYRFSLEENMLAIFKNHEHVSEYDILFSSSFESNLDVHKKIIDLYKTRHGLTALEIIDLLKITPSVIYNALEDLSCSDILYKEKTFKKNNNKNSNNEVSYILTDLFCYNYLRLENNFSKQREHIIYGYCFEIFTRLNIDLVRKAIGRNGLMFNSYHWKNEYAEIDLILEDADLSYFIIECKNYHSLFELNNDYINKLNSKINEFDEFLNKNNKKKNQLKLILFSVYGTKKNNKIPFINISLEQELKHFIN